MVCKFQYPGRGKLIALCLLFVLFGFWRNSLAQKQKEKASEKVHQAEQKIRSSKSQLEKIEGEIEEVDTQAKGLEKKETNLIRQIHDYERKIDDSERMLRSLNNEIEEITSEINYINHQLESLALKLELKKAILYRRLRGIYKQGRLHKFSVLLGSYSFTDLLQRYKYFTLIAAQDKRLVHEVSQLQHTYSEYKLASERKLAQRVERRALLEAEQRKLELAEGERQKLLRSVKSRKEEVLQILAQRRAEAERIREMIAEWERLRREAVEQARREGRVLPPESAYLEGKKGKLAWPVAEGKMIRGFGTYIDEITKTRVINNGIDIQARAGDNVLSVSQGAVRFVDWYRSYGKTVMVDHGAGMYSIYSHLGEVFVELGDFVNTGQAIASVGSTGSLEGPMLHFELRDGMKAVDPLLWLSR